MSSTEQHLKKIQEKLQQLVQQYAALVKENKKLREELESASGKITTQQKYTEELRQQVGILKAGAGEMNEGDKKEFEKRINGYLKEIERCIGMLGE